jgi:gas vesicle protein
MATRTTDLALRVQADVDDAVSGLDDVADAASRMAREVEDATDAAAAGADRLDRVAEGADGLADKSSKATGALGALGSGFALVGLEEYAAGLEAAAMATDFFSGVGDALSLVMETGAIAKAKDVAITAAQTTATAAQTAATTAASAAQGVFNAVMAANPIALVVIAVVALVAAVVLAYKKSEEFREVVDAVMGAASKAVGWVIDKVENLIDWVGKVPEKWDDIKEKVSNVIGDVLEKIADLRDKGMGVWDDIKEKAEGIKDALIAPIQAVIDKVQGLIDKITSIKLPDIDLPFNGRGNMPNAPAAGGFDGSYDDAYGAGGNARVVNRIEITINGAVDKYGTARELRQMLRDLDLLEGIA